MKAAALSSTPLLAALAWVGVLLTDPGPFHPAAVVLLGLGLAAPATVAMVGMTVTGGRWAHRLGHASVAATLALAVVLPLAPWWWVALALSLGAAIALSTPALLGSLRRLPPATSIPWRALLIPLLLLEVPFALGLAVWDEAQGTALVVGSTAPAAAFWFARVLPGGLFMVRLAWPLTSLALSPFQGWAPALVSVVAGLSVAALAWHPSVKVAFHPPRERGTVVPIPPELVPGEVLEAADIDDRGRPRR